MGERVRSERRGRRERWGNRWSSLFCLVYTIRMTQKTISGGTAHKIPSDLRASLSADTRALGIWESLTPLARNEWICWVTFVKQDKTRKEHVIRTVSELKEGMRRPCCWIGCTHRKDKPISASQKFILGKRSKKR